MQFNLYLNFLFKISLILFYCLPLLTRSEAGSNNKNNNNIKNIKQSYLWGTYKPHLIFNLEERKINPLNIGFMYFMQRSLSQNQA